jgi:hypothetical protein
VQLFLCLLTYWYPRSQRGLAAYRLLAEGGLTKKATSDFAGILTRMGSAERRTLDTERHMLTDTSQGSMKSLKYRANRLR